MPFGEHWKTETVRPDGEYQVNCTCGAMWTHGKETTTEVMDQIFASHKKYFNNKTVIL